MCISKDSHRKWRTVQNFSQDYQSHTLMVHIKAMFILFRKFIHGKILNNI